MLSPCRRFSRPLELFFSRHTKGPTLTNGDFLYKREWKCLLQKHNFYSVFRASPVSAVFFQKNPYAEEASSAALRWGWNTGDVRLKIGLQYLGAVGRSQGQGREIQVRILILPVPGCGALSRWLGLSTPLFLQRPEPWAGRSCEDPQVFLLVLAGEVF